jgi:hypothetical protein
MLSSSSCSVVGRSKKVLTFISTPFYKRKKLEEFSRQNYHVLIICRFRLSDGQAGRTIAIRHYESHNARFPEFIMCLPQHELFEACETIRTPSS